MTLAAFLTKPLPTSLRPPTLPPSRKTCTAAIPNPKDDIRPRFRTEQQSPKRSFLPTDSTPTATPSLQTPNERVLAQIQLSMQRLGVVVDPPSQPAPRNPVDISSVNPLSAFGGSVGAAAISFAAWTVLRYTIEFFLSHPLTTEIYVVQRITAVVRTVLVCLFALGSGISGVTALGLFALAVRTAFAAVTGEFRDKKSE